jgi:hypothetical protein
MASSNDYWTFRRNLTEADQLPAGEGTITFEILSLEQRDSTDICYACLQ